MKGVTVTRPMLDVGLNALPASLGKQHAKPLARNAGVVGSLCDLHVNQVAETARAESCELDGGRMGRPLPPGCCELKNPKNSPAPG